MVTEVWEVTLVGEWYRYRTNRFEVERYSYRLGRLMSNSYDADMTIQESADSRKARRYEDVKRRGTFQLDMDVHARGEKDAIRIAERRLRSAMRHTFCRSPIITVAR